MSNYSRSELESRILDGIDPPCPSCGSKLVVGDEQTGKSGANGRSYYCSKDKLGEGQTDHCELVPGFAYISALRNVKRALSNNITSKIINVVGTVSFAGIFALMVSETARDNFISSFTGGSSSDTEETTEVDESGARSGKASSSGRSSNVDGDEMQRLREEARSLKKDAKTLSVYRWKLGMLISGYPSSDFKSSSEGKNFLFEALENKEVTTDKDISAVLVQLRELTVKHGTSDEFEKLLKLLEGYDLADWRERHSTLAIVYYNLARLATDTDLQKVYRHKALDAYYCASEQNNGKLPQDAFNEVVELVRLLYATKREHSDSTVYNNHFLSSELMRDCK